MSGEKWILKYRGQDITPEGVELGAVCCRLVPPQCQEVKRSNVFLTLPLVLIFYFD